MARLNLSNDLEVVLNNFHLTVSSDVAAEVQRLLHSPGGGYGHGPPRFLFARQIAYYALLLFSAQVEGKSFVGIVPGNHDSFADRIDILTDRIFRFDPTIGAVRDHGEFC